MKTKAIFILAILFGVFGLAQAQGQQSDFKWPENKAKASEHNARYVDSKSMGNYRDAANDLYWLLVHAPDLNPAIYIDGAEIYNELAEKATEPKEKQVMQDSALLMYDLRIKYFGNEADILDRKAYYAYKYYDKNDKEKIAELYDLLNKVVELNDNKTSFPNAVAFMDIVRRHKKINKALSDEEVLEHYDKVNSILDHHISQAGNNADALVKYKAIIEDMLISSIEVTCEFVEKNFGPKMQESPEDPELAKKVFTLLKAGKCTDTPLFTQSVETIYKNEPTYEMAKYLGDIQLSDKNYAEAEKYYTEAADMTDDPAKKGEMFFDMAETFRKIGRKSEARSMAYKAMEANPGLSSKGYTMIGDMYMSSTECYKKESLLEDRLIFLAAHKMYQKAGNSAKMAEAAKQFPSGEEMFDEGKKVGDQMTVGCWINETVTLQKR